MKASFPSAAICLLVYCVPVCANMYPVQAGRKLTYECVFDSAARHGVAPALMLGALTAEGAFEGFVKRQTNNTFDMGRLSINSVHLKELERFGVSREMGAYYLQHDGCYAMEFASWLMARRLRDPRDQGKDYWTRAAGFHSRTPSVNARYQPKLKAATLAWQRRIDEWEKYRNALYASSQERPNQ